jgi:hypothetical protein
MRGEGRGMRLAEGRAKVSIRGLTPRGSPRVHVSSLLPTANSLTPFLFSLTPAPNLPQYAE